MSATATQPVNRSPLTFANILRRSLVHRRARSFSALIALTVSAAVATALLTLYADLDAKLHHEFRTFGANIVVTANSGLPPDAMARVQQAAGSDVVAAPFGYAVATTGTGTPVVVAGTDFTQVRRLDSWWQVDTWPETSDSNAALLGQRAVQFVGNANAPTLTFNGQPITVHTAGHVRTGGDEDSRIYVPLAAFTHWTGKSPSVLEVQVPGNPARIESAIKALQTSFPGAQVRPIRQLVEGESRIVDRTHSLMYAAVLLIALTVAVSVLATLSASVLERRRDFALMKALGGSHSQILSLFLVEALAIAIAGVIAGYVTGSIAALIISEVNFHTATLPRVSVVPIILILNLAIAAAAAFLPSRVLRSLQPAALLRGD
jgi:putative ABC transport system permease protein